MKKTYMIPETKCIVIDTMPLLEGSGVKGINSGSGEPGWGGKGGGGDTPESRRGFFFDDEDDEEY